MVIPSMVWGVGWLLVLASRLCHCSLGTILSSWLLRWKLVVLAGDSLLSATAGRAGSWNEVGDGLGNGSNHVFSELEIFLLIFLLEPEALVFVHIGPAQVLDFGHDVE